VSGMSNEQTAEQSDESPEVSSGVSGLAVGAVLAAPVIASLVLADEAGAARGGGGFWEYLTTAYLGEPAYWSEGPANPPISGGHAVLPDSDAVLRQTTAGLLYANTTQIFFKFAYSALTLAWEVRVNETGETFSGIVPTGDDVFSGTFSLTTVSVIPTTVTVTFSGALEPAYVDDVSVGTQAVL